MNQHGAMRLSLELLETAEAAILSTIDPDGFPQTRAMFNLRRADQFPGLVGFFIKHKDDFVAYFTTNTSSPKTAQVRVNPRVSVYYYKPSEFRGLMLGGELEIVTDNMVKESIWQPGWEMYYPGGVHDPDYTVLRLAPRVAKYYHQLQFFHFNFRSEQ